MCIRVAREQKKRAVCTALLPMVRQGVDRDSLHRRGMDGSEMEAEGMGVIRDD